MPVSRFVFALLLLFVLIPLNLWAQPNLSIGSDSGPPGATLQIPVNLTTGVTVVGLQMDLQYNPALLSPGSAAGGGALSGHSIGTSIPTPGTYRLLIYSMNNTQLGSGTLVTVPFTIATAAQPGSTSVSPVSVLLSDNTATAVSPSSLESGTVTIQPQQGGVADLSVTIAGAPATVQVGGQLTYTVDVANAGPSADPAVTVNTSIPAGVTSDSVTPSQGSCQSGNPTVCSLGNLASGGTASITIVTTVTSEGLLSATVSVSGAEVDPIAQNNNDAAQNTATTGGAPTPNATETIPTLNEVALLMLMMFLLAAGLWFLRGQKLSREVDRRGGKQ